MYIPNNSAEISKVKSIPERNFSSANRKRSPENEEKFIIINPQFEDFPATEFSGSSVPKSLNPGLFVPQTVETPILERTAYVFQLKPSASRPEIEGILGKYDLEIVGGLLSIGLIYVGTKSTVTTASTTEVPATLSEVLSPEIVKNFCAEEIVGVTSVNSTPKTDDLPMSVATSMGILMNASMPI